jgi:hypothetical protein
MQCFLSGFFFFLFGRTDVEILFGSSCAAYSTQPPPAQKASEIIDKMPSSPGLLTKTGAAVLGTGLTAAAISQELYVVNEETVLLVGSLIMFTFIGKVCQFSSS